MSLVSDMFSDSGSFWGDLAQRAMPSLMTALFVKKPDINGALQQAAPYYNAVGQSAGKSDAFADEQAGVFRDKFLPGAQQQWDEAQRIGSTADLGKTAGRINADTNQAYDRALQGYDINARSHGVDPSSSAYLAGRGALGRTFAPNLVDNLNRGLDSRAATGFDLRNKALQNFNMKPDYGSGANMRMSAAAGGVNIANTLDRNYRNEARDVSEAFQMAKGPTEPQSRAPSRTLEDWVLGRYPTAGGGSTGGVRNYDYSLGGGATPKYNAWE